MFPSQVPSDTPTPVPSEIPTLPPSMLPTALPTEVPSASPTAPPTEVPTQSPTSLPTPPPSQADEVAVVVKLVLKAKSDRHVNEKVVFKAVSNTVRGCKKSKTNSNLVFFDKAFNKAKKRATVEFDVRMDLDTTRFTDADELDKEILKRFKKAVKSGDLTAALEADCNCELEAVDVSTSLKRDYPTLNPTPFPSSAIPSSEPTSVPSMVPSHLPTSPTMLPSPYCYVPCPASVKVLIDYVEVSVGEVVTWLHEKDEYLEALMDVLYGSTSEPGAHDDDTYRGYGTFGSDDGSFKGPQSSSGKTDKGGDNNDDLSAHNVHVHQSDNDDPPSSTDLSKAASRSSSSSDARNLAQRATQAKAKLGGVTKLAAELYAIPTLKAGEAYARASTTEFDSASVNGASGLPSRRANVVSAAALSNAYYDALTELTKSSVHYESLIAVPSKKQQETEAAKHSPSSFATEEDDAAALHPALTAFATVAAFAVGIVATKHLN